MSNLQEWVADGRRRQPARSAEIIYLHPLLLTDALPAEEFPAEDHLTEEFPAEERLTEELAPATGRRWRLWKRKKSTLSWPEKIIAIQIGFTLESVIMALEKFVG